MSLNRPPVSIVASKLLPDRTLALVRPNGIQALDIPHRLDSVEWSVVPNGGEESCSINLASARNQGNLWLSVCGGDLKIFDATALRVFHGTIVTVEVNDGTRTSSLTTEGMANAIRVAFTKKGKAITNARTTNDSSRALYFTRDLIYSVGEMTQAEADNTQARLLQALAWPFENTISGLTTSPGIGEASVAIQVRGWWHALGWAAASLKQINRSGTTLTNQLIGNIEFAAFSNSTPTSYGNEQIPVGTLGANSITFTGPAADSGTGPTGSAWPVTQGDETALESTERLLSRGDSSGKKLAYGINLRLYREVSVLTSIYGARVWAGDSPTTIAYYVRSPGQLLGAHLCPIPWTQARPDTMVQNLGTVVAIPLPSSAVDSNGRFWTARTTYRWQRGQGEALTLAPEGHQDLATVLARMR